MKAITILLALALVGCSTTDLVKPEQTVIQETRYIVKIPPKELLTLPAPLKAIDVDKSTQGDVAKLLSAYENRMTSLEDLIKGLAQFFKKEQDILDETAKKENTLLLQKALTQTVEKK